VKFLLDVCVSSRSLTAFLEARSHEVLSAISIDPRATDEYLLEFALRDERILITEDKDFGELLFVRHRPHGPLIRIVELTVDEQVEAIGELLDQYSEQLTGSLLVTISRGRFRFRRREL
jgi:predicted nuclease of predicted toxin-antitoxin system